MKKLLTATVLLSMSSIMAQTNAVTTNNVEPVIETNALGQTVTTITASRFVHTAPVTEWDEVTDEELEQIYAEKKQDRIFQRKGYEAALNSDEQLKDDGALQTEMGTKANRAPIVNFNGQSGAFPPDPSGAAGPEHYVQAVNSTYRVYNKDGSSATGIFSLSSLWPGSTNFGDPIVMYDRHADRWFISQFQSGPNEILVAISETGDPTGAYYGYSFNFSQFPDYPKYSIWWDGYYMTSNSTHTAVAFERDVMLAGGASPKLVSLSLPSLGHGGFRSPLPADADGPLPPNGTPCYFFNLEDNAFSGVSQDQIEIYEMTPDWVTTGNSSVVSSQQLSVPAFDAVFSGGFANIAQPGTGQRIDAIQGVLMYRAQHMRWIGYNTIVLSHAVDLGSNKSAVRWYELRDADDGNWTVYQSGTYAPDNADRFMSSAAMDGQGNIGMAYSIVDANATIYPGIRYTGRMAGDALGTMTITEETAIDGLASQTAGDRYGDYGQMSLDPDNTTFWYTGEYLGSGASRRTRIFSFSLATNVGIENEYYDDLTMSVVLNETHLDVNVDGIHGNEAVVVELIGMDGRVISSTTEVPANLKVSKQLDATALNGGIYFVRVGNANFQKAIRVLVTE
jgi:hypothetical protein